MRNSWLKIRPAWHSSQLNGTRVAVISRTGM